MPDHAVQPYLREEFEGDEIGEAVVGDVERRLSVWERISNIDAVRKFSVLITLVVAWELYSRIGDINELMFPTFSATGTALYSALVYEGLMTNVWNSLSLLLMGYAIGVGIAAVLVVFGVWTRFGSDLLTTLTAMLNPLPAIALLPMAMLWFGLGPAAIVFTLLHSIIWPVALNTHSGFMGVSETQRMVGRNYGLRGLPYIYKILIPAAFPSILTGLRIGWAFAWRTLIAAELVFGGQVADTSGQLGAEGGNAGGLGWIIFQNQMENQTPYVFAGLFAVILVGIILENGIFRNIEDRTIRRWGMQVA
ncbi:MAG: ABC transporter permease [Alphaproteobacteria bacterium]|nr:ABC transporter permease [Alphaproteobacteria bacterium]|tara:strand:+ start:443 stop:1363 length:921 start_codon:yes stop_codon:yes gene_type:complete